MINLCAEALYRAVRGVGDDVGRRRGNTVSFHVTVLCPYSSVRLDTGTETGFSALVFSALAETGFTALLELRFSALVSTLSNKEVFGFNMFGPLRAGNIAILCQRSVLILS